jgi:prepilin-type N-terminal cleavage/methylation domain-containing protein
MMLSRRSMMRVDGGCARRRGFTLLELVVALAVAAIAAAMAYPSVAALGGNQSSERAAVALLMDLRLAQWRAVVTGARVRLVPELSGSGAWGYRLEVETPPAGWRAAGPPRELPRGLALRATGSAAKLFNPDGTSSSGGLVLATPAGALYRYTLAPATGRVRFYRGDREAARAR